MAEAQTKGSVQAAKVDAYVSEITHSWLRTLTILGGTLVPLFFLLDWVIIPQAARDLLPRFGIYRLVSTIIVFIQLFIVRRTHASRFSFIHAYVFTMAVSFAITLMTVDLGGFRSGYYAGLNLVMIAVNMLMPWAAIHSVFNSLITIGMYIVADLFWGSPFELGDMISNLYFMFATMIIAVGITYVRHELVIKEFLGRLDLQSARDALWGEMEIAKRIQTALLPVDPSLAGYEIGATMLPADEVGGDYYDIIDIGGRKWFIIGDVSGHGVESGLIMMMTQTSVRSTLNTTPSATPSRVLAQVNTVIKENIQRLGAERYMTISALCFDDDRITFAGKHQDIYVWRHSRNEIEILETDGTWLGIVDDMAQFLTDNRVDVGAGDIVLLFTDGITEAESKGGEMYGEDRLREAMARNAHLPVKEILSNILRDVTIFAEKRSDDLTLLVVKKL